MTVLLERQLRGGAARQLQFRALTAARHAIGKGGQDAQQERILVGGAARRGTCAGPAQLAEESRGIRRPLRFQQHQQVRSRGVRRARRKALARAEQCGYRAAVAGHSAAARFHHQAAQARVQRIARHFPGRIAGGSELAQQVRGLIDGGGWRSVQPMERTRVPYPWPAAAARWAQDLRGGSPARPARAGGRNPPADTGEWRGPARCVRRVRHADWRWPG